MKQVSKKVGFASTLLMALGVHFGVTLIEISFGFLVVAFLRERGWERVDRKMAFALAAFGILCLLHNAIGVLPTENWAYMLRWRFAFLLVFIPPLLDYAQRKRVMDLLLGLTCVSGLYGLIQVFADLSGWLDLLTDGEKDNSLGWANVVLSDLFVKQRLASGLIDNIASFSHTTSLVLLWPVSLSVFEKRLPRAWEVVALVFGLGGLYMSGARAVWLALAVGVATIFLAKVMVARFRTFMFSLLAMVSIAGSALVIFPQLQEHAGHLAGRDKIWKQCRSVAVDSFPRGLGYGNYTTYSTMNYPKTLGMENFEKTWCHNVLLSMAAEAPLALVAFVILMCVLVGGLCTQKQTVFSLQAAAALVAFAVLGQFHDPHFQREFFPLSMLVMSLGLGKQQRAENL